MAASSVCSRHRRVHPRMPGDLDQPQAQGVDGINVLSDLFVLVASPVTSAPTTSFVRSRGHLKSLHSLTEASDLFST
jgi:hypothetical protein